MSEPKKFQKQKLDREDHQGTKNAAKTTKTVGGIAFVATIIGAAIKKNGVDGVKKIASAAVKGIFRS